MKTQEIALLRKIADRMTPIMAKEAELRIARDLTKQGYIHDIRTNLHILMITPAGLAALESIDQIKAAVKPTELNLGPISARLTDPKLRENTKYRIRSTRIPEGLNQIPRYRFARDKDKDTKP